MFQDIQSIPRALYFERFSIKPLRRQWGGFFMEFRNARGGTDVVQPIEQHLSRDQAMAKQSKAQKETIHRVMHEFKEGDLRSGGKGPKVKNPKQAVAIALHEAGASNQERPEKNRENLRRTKSLERNGKK